MGRKLRLLIVLIFALVGIAAGDQVTLKNGDRITGKIVKKDGPKLTIRSDAFGEISAGWDAIQSVTSDEPLVIQLPDNREVTGKLTTEGGNIAVATGTTVENAALANIRSIRIVEPLNPGILDLWAGYFDVGFALSRGNARTNTITSALNASRLTRRDKTTLYYNQIYAKARINNVTSDTAEAIRGGWAYNRNITDRLFANFFNDYEYDRFQSLDLRVVAGLGLGYSVIKSDRVRLDLVGGGAFNNENFFTFTRNSAEIYWGDDLFFRVGPNTSLLQSYRMFNNLTRTGDYRVNFDLGISTQINRLLGLQITFSDRYLSAPAPGQLKNDVLFSTGLRLSFAR